VVAAGGDGPETRRALESLCEAYWYPLYAYARRRGNSPEQAQDHTQEFFARFLEHDYFDRADRDRGRFRSFLLASFNHFLCDEAGRSQAKKRGGGIAPLAFEFSQGEDKYEREPFHNETPERLYERRWAHTVVERALDRLRAEFAQSGRAEYFNQMKGFLQGDPDGSYAELARRLNTTESALKVSVHRQRKRYRDLLRAEVGDILTNPEDIDDELRYLIAALAGNSASPLAQ
jgi:RNA polymerase sigma-70 factor (ECF subfamily)